MIHESLLLGVSAGNVGGMDVDTSLHGYIHNVFWKICLETVAIQVVLNSYLSLKHELFSDQLDSRHGAMRSAY